MILLGRGVRCPEHMHNGGWRPVGPGRRQEAVLLS